MASPFASVTSEVIIQIKFCGVYYLTVLGPLHMSPVTGTISVVCSYGKFQRGRLGLIQETQPKWLNINLYCSQLS